MENCDLWQRFCRPCQRLTWLTWKKISWKICVQGSSLRAELEKEWPPQPPQSAPTSDSLLSSSNLFSSNTAGTPVLCSSPGFLGEVLSFYSCLFIFFDISLTCRAMHNGPKQTRGQRSGNISISPVNIFPSLEEGRQELPDELHRRNFMNFILSNNGTDQGGWLWNKINAVRWNTTEIDVAPPYMNCSPHTRVAEVVRGHGGPPPKSLDSDENF